MDVIPSRPPPAGGGHQHTRPGYLKSKFDFNFYFEKCN